MMDCSSAGVVSLRDARGALRLWTADWGGKLVIYFFSDEELDGLYRAICAPDQE